MPSFDEVFQTGLSHHQQGELQQAADCYRHVLESEPEHAGAWHFLGVIAITQHDTQTAIEYIEKALSICDTKAVYWNNYGVALKEAHRHQDAGTAFIKAVQLKNNYADAWSNLGLLQSLAKQHTEAERSLRLALVHQPDHQDAQEHLGDLLCQTHRHVDAVALYNQVLKTKANNPTLIHKLADALVASDRLNEANRLYKQAVDAKPNDLQLRHQQASFLIHQEQIEDAVPAVKSIAILQPQNSMSQWRHLGLCPVVFPDTEALDRYWATLNDELDRLLESKATCDWRSLPYEGFIPSFNLPHHGRCCLEARSKFGRFFSKMFPHVKPKLQYGQRKDGRIRVGFLVMGGSEPGFCRVWSGIIEQLDHKRFDVVVLCKRSGQQYCQSKIESNTVRYVTFDGSFEQIATTVRNAGCDVLTHRKVGTDPLSYFLPFTQPAPIQGTSCGTHGTSGVPAVDYFLSSRDIEPENAQQYYAESLYLLDSLPTYEKQIPPPVNVSRNEFDLPERGALYLCPHRPAKYHPEFDAYLREILERDATGHLILLTGNKQHPVEMLKLRFQKTIGETLLKRIRFFPSMRVQQYYRLLSLATMILDSSVYAGGLTSFDALALDVPEVTLSGPLHVQNYATGIYRHMEMPDIPTTNREQYIDLAVKLGTEPDYRHEVSQRINRQKHLIFGHDNDIPNWERFFEEAVEKEVRKRGHQQIGPQISPAVSHEQASDAVIVDDIEVNVTYGCNLGCEYCSHFCKYTQGLEHTDNIFSWYRDWNKKIVPRNVRLIGGEPLLHPELATLIRETKRHWPNSGLQLTTNGLLLHKADDLFEALAETGAHVFMSQHYNDEEYNSVFFRGIDRLIHFGIGYSIYTSYMNWRKLYHIDVQGKLLPYQSDHEKAWQNCLTKNACLTLLDNKVYKCQHIAHVFRCRSEGILDDHWDISACYQPLSKDALPSQIREHLNSEAVPACCICPERYEFVDLKTKRHGKVK